MQTCSGGLRLVPNCQQKAADLNDALPASNFQLSTIGLSGLERTCMSIANLNKLRIWVESHPFVPEGERYKDFGSFKSTSSHEPRLAVEELKGRNYPALRD